MALKKVVSSLQQTLGNIKMATTNFVHGTLIESTWLNDADAHVYDQVPAAHTAANIAVVDAGGHFTATDVEGVLAELSAGGGLLYFAEARSITAPNATVPAHSFTALGAETDIDAILAAKGSGAILVNVPDNTTTGGDKRGSHAVDFQKIRTASTQVASGSYAAILGGNQHTVSGGSGAALGGALNTVSGASAVVLGGSSGTASGTSSVILGGSANVASGNFSVCVGGSYGTTRGLLSRVSQASGRFLTTGDAQIGTQVLFKNTVDATPAIATADGAVPSATNVSVLPDNHAYTIVAHITARDTTTGDLASWQVTGAIKRGTGVATTALVGTPTVTQFAVDAGAATWAVALIADTTLGAAEIQVTGEAATTINWVCKFSTIEVG